MTDAEVLRWYECERKVPHSTERGAEIAAYDAWRNRPITANPPSVYPCDHCNGYHVGRGSTTSRREILRNARKTHARYTRYGGVA